MKLEDVFAEISSTLDTKLSNELLNPYGAEMTDFIPNVFPDNVNPQIVLSQLDYSLGSESLDKSRKQFMISIEVDIFTVDQATTHKRVIANDVCDMIYEHIDSYGLRLDMRDITPNLQENVYRITMRFSGKIDEHTEIIYRE